MHERADLCHHCTSVKTAVAYYIGADPALRRPKDVVQKYAAWRKLRIVRDFWDGSSDTPISERTGLAAMLAYVLGGGARVVLVEVRICSRRIRRRRSPRT